MLLRRAFKPLLQRNSKSSFRRYISELQEDENGIKKWKLTSIFLVAPAILVTAYINIVYPEDHTPPEFREYEHIRLRTKPFKWRNGDQSLFHNPYVNATRDDGYEKEYVHEH